MIVPSRGRPQNVAALWESWQATTTASADLLVCVDDDDPELDAYRQGWEAAGGCDGYRLQTGPRLRLGGTLNAASRVYAEHYRAIGFLGDDHRPRTAAWNERFLSTLDGLGTGLVYGNDLIQGRLLPTAVAMSSDIVRTLGYMVPPGLTHLYIDSAWLALGQTLDRLTYLPDVVIEHMHPLVGKAPSDAGYEEVNSSAMYAADSQAYEAWVRDRLDNDVTKLKELMERG
ncbi:hypothetical protein KALB_4986 [Kutzneria albida DSM 43870]|uniref:Glycosyltransferase 2-like domain-containing protein n=2 Tax=Kutzneria TaxID=43356 RepID=W5WB25_9PSEU|nr:hypothetical protein KALB_4986 [Kutzneria albida DSM 43870]